MSDREAPRVFVSYSHDSQAHKDQVRQFAEYLRTRIGLDVHLDQWYDSRRRDWSVWAIEQLTEADVILVIASPEYKRRADGAAESHEGRGSQFEAAIIRDNLTRNLLKETERVLPVVLPGRSIDEIPTFLNAHSTTRFEIDEFTDEGVKWLLTAITGHGQYPMPERGQWRDGTEGPPEPLPATGLRWLTNGPEVRQAGAVIDKVRYDNSIVLRASTFPVQGFVEIDLGGHYSRLTAVVGVLDDAEDWYQVGRFRVLLDGNPQLAIEAARGKSGTVDVNVTGAQTLRLEMSRQAKGGFPELAWGNPTLR